MDEAAVTAKGSGAPPRYEELRRFFPTQKLRALALGAKPDTVRAWDRRAASRVWEAHARQALLLLELCELAERYMDATAAGEWMLAPQPFLYGDLPARALKRGGEPVADLVRRAILNAPAGPPKDIPDARDLWAALADEPQAATKSDSTSTRKRTLSGFAPLREDDDVTQVAHARPID